MIKTDAFTRSVRVWILFFSFILFTGIVAVSCLGWLVMENAVSRIVASANLQEASDMAYHYLTLSKSRGMMVLLPLAMILIIFWSFALWAVLRRIVKKAGFEAMGFAQRDTQKPSRPVSTIGEKIIYRTDKQKEKRLFAYWLTAFQREGRLVDFFSEDLKNYDDAQIGAAVRNIHDSCRNVIIRHLKMKPIIDLEEGSRLTLEKGFDSQAFRLVGNVKGEPPFNGFIRHRGWKITQWNIPDLNGELEPDIVAPAEIEIR